MTYGSLFSGAGGFDMGFHALGFKCLWTSEINSNASDVLAKLGAPNHGDICKIDPESIDAPDVVIGGSPCQDLSIANRNREGLKGNTSGLFYEQIRITKSLFRRGTKYAVWENVAGALHSNGGNDFRQVLQCFLECGAREVMWRIVDARYFGVPQTRRRIILIATTRTLGQSPDFLCDYPQPGGLCLTQSQDNGLEDTRGEAALALVARSPERSARADLMTAIKTQRPENDMHPSYMMTTAVTTQTPRAGNVRASDAMVTNQVSALLARSPSEQLRDGIANHTVLSYPKQGIPIDAVHEGKLLRWRTPLESERLIGWPDDWTRYGASGKEMTKTARYMMCGNGVVYQVGRWAASHILQMEASA